MDTPIAARPLLLYLFWNSTYHGISVWHFSLASVAPRRPEVEQNYSAFIGGQIHGGTLRILEGEVWSHLPRSRRRVGTFESSRADQEETEQGCSYNKCGQLIHPHGDLPTPRLYR